MNRLFGWLAVGCVLMAAVPAPAALVFSEDFTGLTNGEVLTTSNTDLTYIRIGSGGGVINALAPGNFTGNSPSAIVTQATSGGALNGIGVANTLPLSDVYELSLDFRLTDLTGDVVIGVGAGSVFTGNSAFTTNQGLFWLQSDSGNFERRTSGWSDVGGGTILTVDTDYALRVLANGSATAVTYPGGSVAAGSMDIYLNGSLLDDDVPVTTSGLQANGFRIYQVNQGNFEVDNIQLSVVPEPSMILLASIGGLALGSGLLRRRTQLGCNRRTRTTRSADSAGSAVAW